jgi:hypothetical protein
MMHRCTPQAQAARNTQTPAKAGNRGGLGLEANQPRVFAPHPEALQIENRKFR